MKNDEPIPKIFEPTNLLTVQRPERKGISIANPIRLSFTNLKPHRPEDSDSPNFNTPKSIKKSHSPRQKLDLNFDRIPSAPKSEETGKSPMSSLHPLGEKTSFVRVIKTKNSPSRLSIDSQDEAIFVRTTRRQLTSEIPIVKVMAPTSLTRGVVSVTPAHSHFLKIPMGELTKRSDLSSRSREEMKIQINSASRDLSHSHVSGEELPKSNNEIGTLEDNIDASMIRRTNRMLTASSIVETHNQLTRIRVPSMQGLHPFGHSPAGKNLNINDAVTIKEIGFNKSSGASPRGDATRPIRKCIKVLKTPKAEEETVKGKSSKAVHRFTDAVEMAKVYNDKVILQYNFEKQNEEEENDFNDLVDMLGVGKE